MNKLSESDENPVSEIEDVHSEIDEIRSEDLDSLLNKYFTGRVVRKDLTKQLKEGANVPVYVLERLDRKR